MLLDRGSHNGGFFTIWNPPKPLITIIKLQVLIYCCELSLTLSIAFSCLILIVFCTFPCSVSPTRPTCVWSSGRVGSWFNDMLHSLWLSQQEGLSPAASCQCRASDVIQPIIRQQKTQPTVSPFFTVDTVAYSLKFYLEYHSRCVVWVNTPFTKSLQNQDPSGERTGAQMSQIQLFIWWESVYGCQHGYWWFRGLSAGLFYCSCCWK